MSDRHISEIDRRARTAGYADGLLDIFAAAVLAVLALGWVANPGFVGVLAAFIVLYGWKLVERVKARVTYPRIGYYQEKADESVHSARGMLLFIGGAFLAMVVAVWVSGGLTDATEWRRAAPLVSGISLAGGFWYSGQRSGLVRYRVIAAGSLIGGVALWVFGSGDSYSGVVWHLVGIAIPLAVTGVVALVHFLKTHPIPEVPVDG